MLICMNITESRTLNLPAGDTLNGGEKADADLGGPATLGTEDAKT